MDKSARMKGNGAKDKLVGKAQETWGDLTNNPRHQAEGEYKQAKGELKTETAKALDTIEHLVD